MLNSRSAFLPPPPPPPVVRERRMHEATKILEMLRQLHAKPILHNTVQLVQLLNRISIDSAAVSSSLGDSSGALIDESELMNAMGMGPPPQQPMTNSLSTIPFNDVSVQHRSPWDSMIETLPIQRSTSSMSSSSSSSSSSYLQQRQYHQQQQQQQLNIQRRQQYQYHSDVSEQIIIRDLIFNIQGVDGQYLRFDPLEERFTFGPTISVPVSTRTIVSKLTELGWLFRRIKSFVEHPIKGDAGLVHQSFCAAINVELTAYYRQVALLEQNVYSASTQPVEQQVTLKKLFVWHMEPLERLKTLAVLVDACRDKRGGALLSVIHSYTKHGEPSVHSFISGILKQVCQPIYDMIRRWLFEGVLEDPFYDFFITSDINVPITNLWNRKFSVVENMIPSFLSKELANDILLVGKSINFIRHCCDDTEWIMDSTTVAIAVDAFQYQHGANSFDTPIGYRKNVVSSKLEKIIERAQSATNRRVMELLFDKYEFHMHSTALKQYLLLGQGDFIQYLMELLHEELNKPSHSIYRYNLIGIVESAVRGSNAQYDNSDVLNRLDVSLLSNSSSSVNSGWDIFSLDYRVTSPIDTIFTKPAMSTYLSIFRHLWKIKRVELLLSSVWTNHMALAKMINAHHSRSDSNGSDVISSIQSTLHSCNIMRHKMVHFVSNLQYYLMFEVIESSWDKLEQTLSKLRCEGNLDQLIAAHHRFLSRIIERALLNKANANLRIQIEKLLSCVMQFVALQDTMYSTTNELLHKISQTRTSYTSEMMDDEDDNDDMMMSESSSSAQQFAHLSSSPEFQMIQSITPKLQVIQQTFTSLFTSLSQMLSETDIHQTGAHKPLLTLQPFNDYYRMGTN